MGVYEDTLEELRDLDVPDEVITKLEGFKGSSLRAKAEAAGALEKERDELKAQIARYEAGPVRQSSFKDFGIDMENLSPAEAEILSNVEVPEGGFTKEQLAEIADKYQLPMTEASQAEEEGTNAEKVVTHARTNQGRTAATVIKPQDTAGWPADKLRRLYDSHRDEYEALLRGETVNLAFQ
jgi:hypothetical protein